ncbi:MAG: hypothetical protein IBJ11_00375 [Phycisphaerales bacterium]|nr:hypothetical protein [Phycisphaerales bacterium]
MTGPAPTPSRPTEADRSRFDAAVVLLGGEVLRWRDGEATLRLPGGEAPRLAVSWGTLDTQSAVGLSVLDAADTALEIGPMLNLPAPAGLLADLRRIEGRLRPRLVSTAALTGPARLMCRRDGFGDLLRAVSVGSGSARGAWWVTTRHLDDWGVTFEDVMAAAVANARACFGPRSLVPLPSARGVLAMVTPRERSGSAVFVLDTLLPWVDPGVGAVFSVPTDDALLVLPLSPGSGAGPLAELVRVTLGIDAERSAGGGETLSDQVFWWHGGRAGAIEHVPMTAITERRGQRVHLEAEGTVARLLRLLGEID